MAGGRGSAGVLGIFPAKLACQRSHRDKHRWLVLRLVVDDEQEVESLDLWRTPALDGSRSCAQRAHRLKSSGQTCLQKSPRTACDVGTDSKSSGRIGHQVDDEALPRQGQVRGPSYPSGTKFETNSVNAEHTDADHKLGRRLQLVSLVSALHRDETLDLELVLEVRLERTSRIIAIIIIIIIIIICCCLFSNYLS